jgi:hypothetical protein
MAAKSPRMAKDAGKTYPPTTDSINEMPAEMVSSEPVPRLNTPQRAAVDAIFQNEASVRQAIKENLTTLRPESDAVAKRVQEAFRTFNPSQLSTEELARRHYVAPGADPAEMLDAVIIKGVDALRSANTDRAITFRNSADLKKLIKKAPKPTDSLNGVAELGPLIDFINSKSKGSSLITEPTYTLCKAELEADKILEVVENPSKSGNGDDAANSKDSSPKTREADQLVKDHVNLQMKSATAPESQLAYGKIPNSADEDKVQSGILQTFQLRPGASDVTSYHDFHTLQIAFEHVWTEIFDGKLASLGRDLYSEYVKLKDFSGSGQPDLQVSTIGDLRRLIDEVRKLSQTVVDGIPEALIPKEGKTKPEDASKGRGIDWGRVTEDVLSGGLAEIIRLAVEEIKKAGTKPVLNWSHIDSRGRPLPNGYGTIIATWSNNAPAGYVQMRLGARHSYDDNSPSKVKIMEFQPWSSSKGMFINHMNGNDRNNLVSNVGHPEPYTTPWIELPATDVESGVIEFASEESTGFNLGRYVLAGLQEKLTSGWQVTFTWTD